MRTKTWPGRLVSLDSADSTNIVAARMIAEGARGDFAVAATRQTAGRGRLGRSWTSPPGLGMYVTIALRPDAPLERYPQLTLVATVAAVETIGETTGTRLAIKWPNDLYLNDRKVGGILAETVPDQEGGAEYAVVGIGLNVLQRRGDFPDDIAAIAASLAEFGESNTTIAELTREFLDRFHSWRSKWERDGFAVVRNHWLDHDCTVGKMVTIRGDPNARALVLGMDETGCLTLRDETGGEFKIIADDVFQM